jgi:hypothetical protein
MPIAFSFQKSKEVFAILLERSLHIWDWSYTPLPTDPGAQDVDFVNSVLIFYLFGAL